MSKIQFITDSAADIPKHLREELDITVMPFPIILSNGDEFLDSVTYSPQEFYKILLESPKIPTHSQLNPFFIYETFEKGFQAGYTDLIYTCINAKGSATYQNALQARDNFFEEHPQAKDTLRIHIINSGTYTIAYGYAVLEGARRAKAGAQTQEILDFISHWVSHARILFVPFDLTFAKKSGRISAAAAFVGDALGIKPIMTFQNGESKILGKVRGEKNAIPAILELAEKTRVPNSPYLIVRGTNAEYANLLCDACKNAWGTDAALDAFVGGAVAINAGPNVIALIFQEETAQD